jgi:hypothetical protein
MFDDHKYRFGTNGKPLVSFFKARKIKQTRFFPFTVKAERAIGRKLRNGYGLLIEAMEAPTSEYVSKYYEYNRKAGIVAFVGC